MKIKLKNLNKNIFNLFNKNFSFYKEKKENILIILKDYRNEDTAFLNTSDFNKNNVFICSLLNELISHKSINQNHSIFIDNYNYELIINYWFHLLEKENKNKLFYFNIMHDENFEEFRNFNLNFKSKNIQEKLLQDVIFQAPSKLSFERENNNKFYYSKLFDYLNNLPDNKDNEVPIFITDILKIKEYFNSKYETLVSNLNNKGYFIVGIIEEFSKEKNINKFSNLYEHIFIIPECLNIEASNLYFKNLSYQISSLLEKNKVLYINNFKKFKKFKVFFDKYSSINKFYNIRKVDYLITDDIKNIQD